MATLPPTRTKLDRAQTIQYYHMLSSLNMAVIEAGGCEYSSEQLMKISVYDLLKTLAPNGIRFMLNKKAKNRLRKGE